MVKRVEELAAYWLAREFKLAVYRLVEDHPKAKGDFRYRSQLFEAAASGEMNVDEGFRRWGAREIVNFLRIARASNSEAQRRIKDGIDRGYFDRPSCAHVLTLGRRAGAAAAGLQRSLKPFIEDGPGNRSSRRER